MKTLEQFNSERLAAIKAAKNPMNGIACPKCGAEMRDSDTSLLMSNPPQRNIDCPQCGHKDYRLA